MIQSSGPRQTLAESLLADQKIVTIQIMEPSGLNNLEVNIDEDWTLQYLRKKINKKLSKIYGFDYLVL